MTTRFNSNIPINKVMELRSQGTPNNQIIQILQSEGYSSDQIFDAMNQADMQSNIGQGINEPNSYPAYTENQMNMEPQGYGGYEQESSNHSSREVIEETTEAIISEKWKEFNHNLEKFTEWKEKIDQQMGEMQSQFKNLQTNFDKLHHALISKIGEYDQNIINVGTEIKAMEKVFQKILPTFTENVNELSRLTKKFESKDK